MIDQREWDAILRDVATYHLLENDPDLHATLRGINADRPTSLDERNIEAVIKPKIAAVRAFHRLIPFITAPPSFLHLGGDEVLRQFANDAPLTFTAPETARGLLVVGGSGSGKTALVLQLCDASLARGQNQWIIEAKGDAPALAVRHPSVLVFSADSPVDIIARPPYLTIPEHIALIVESLARTMYGGQTFKAVLHEALTRTFTHDWPTLQQVITTLDAMPRKGDSYDRINAIRNATLRLRRLIERYPGVTATNGIPLYDLCDKSVLFSFLSYTDVEDVIVNCAIQHLFQYNRHHGIRELSTTIHVDEALLLFRVESTSRINGNPLAELVGLTREFGIGWRLSVNALALVDPAVVANAFAVIALNVNSGAEVKAVTQAMGLSKDEAEYYTRNLTRGQAIVRLGDRWRSVMLCTYEPLPFSKTVSPTDWEEARGRIARMAMTGAASTATPEAGSEQHWAAREAVVSHPAPSRSSAPSPPPTVAAVVEQAPPKKARKPERQGALTAIEQRHVDYIAANGVVLTTECQHDLKLHPQQVARAKAKLLALTLITSATIRCRAGRGGSGVAIALTPAGAELATTKPLRTTRGNDSVQHQFLATRLARAIPNAQLELSLNGKSIDVVIAYDKSAHAQLIKTIAPSIALNDGDLCAFEIEMTPGRTLASNVRKNATVGIAYNIIAVLPNTLASAKKIVKTLDASLRDRATVVDALDLLHHLQESS